MQALGNMTSLKQWFVWRLDWDAAKGNYQKRPVDAGGANNIDHQQPYNWLGYNDAMACVQRLREWDKSGTQFTIGFSLTDNDPYWCLDLDHVIDSKTGQFNNQYAAQIFSTLQQTGCAFEYSSSGTGLHVFGSGQLPQHSCKLRKNIRESYPGICDLELYTSQRGIALGLTGQMWGNADTTNASEFIATALIPAYFPYTLQDTHDAGFIDQPRIDYVGPDSDEDLLRRAMASTNLSDKMAGTASFHALWNNTDDAQQRYPGESERDMALIAHLAFWTGCNPVRIERLMRQSALVRSKWDERRGDLNWLQYSIVNQCKMQKNVLQDKRVDDATTLPVDVAPREIDKLFLGKEDQDIIFKDCVYVVDINKIITPLNGNSIMALNAERFDALKGGYQYVMDPNNTKMEKSAWNCFLNNQFMRRPRVATTFFRPDIKPLAVIEENGQSGVNVWMPPKVPMEQGDVSPVLDLLARQIPDERDQRILINYLAAVVQHPGIKFRMCCVLQGFYGNGKSTWGNILQYAVGYQYCACPSSRSLFSKFNEWQINKVLAVIDDVKIHPGTGDMEMLRRMITETRADIEGKGVAIATRSVCINYLLSMNDPGGIPMEGEERRFSTFLMRQQCKADVLRDFPPGYFGKLNDWLNAGGYAKCAYWLANYPIDPEFDPVIIERAPLSSTQPMLMEAVKPRLDDVLKDYIESGIMGTRGGFVCVHRMLDKLRADGYRIALNDIKRALERAGYIAHPGLPAGRTISPLIMEDNRRVILYVKSDAIELMAPHFRPCDIAAMYTDANKFC